MSLENIAVTTGPAIFTRLFLSTDESKRVWTTAI